MVKVRQDRLYRRCKRYEMTLIQYRLHELYGRLLFSEQIT